MNRQILDKNWVKQSQTSHISRPMGVGFGYQFWIFRGTVQGKVHEWPAAVGNGDQRIFFDRKNNMLVVTTAGNYNKWDLKNNAFDIPRKI